jgi:hypothetical protein
VTQDFHPCRFLSAWLLGPHLDTLADRSRTNEPNTTSNSEATRLQLSRLAVASAQPTGRLDGQIYQPQQQQQQLPQRPERLPRCSTVSLQTELATPSLVVFSGGTAFNSVAGEEGVQLGWDCGLAAPPVPPYLSIALLQVTAT